MIKQEKRNIQIDNIRGLLIFLVVFGHLTENANYWNKDFFYLWIYSFHMPAFVFISGYCCKPHNGKALLSNYVYPYLLFQTLYILFQKYVLFDNIPLQYTTPYWLLWYWLSLLTWNGLISLFEFTLNSWEIVLCGAILIALLVGYDSSVAYYLSLSRSIVMFPFFLAGYYWKHSECYWEKYKFSKVECGLKVLSIGAVAVMSVLLYYLKNHMQARWAYHSLPYISGEYSIGYRIFLLSMAAVFIMFLLLYIPRKNIFLVTQVGQNTMGIYLIHGFIIRALFSAHGVNLSSLDGIHTIILALLICLVLSNKKLNQGLELITKL